MKIILFLLSFCLLFLSCKRRGFDTTKKLQEPQFRTTSEEAVRKLNATDSVVFASHSLQMTSGYIKSETNRYLMFKYYFRNFSEDDKHRMEEICTNIFNQMKKEVKNISEFEGVLIEFYDGKRFLKERSCMY